MNEFIYIEDFITNYNNEDIFKNNLIIFDNQITFIVENIIILCLIRPFKINIYINLILKFYKKLKNKELFKKLIFFYSSNEIPFLTYQLFKINFYNINDIKNIQFEKNEKKKIFF